MRSVRHKSGFLYGFFAYLTWGGFPFYFGLLSHVDAFEVIPWRVLTCVLFCVLALTFMGGWRPVMQVIKTPKLLGLFFLSGVLLYINWQIFVYGVLTDRVVETSLGYFITPLITILMGVIFWKEKLRIWQWIAVVVAAIGVVISAVAYGEFPTVALGVAFSFGLYGAVRKLATVEVGALEGLTIESIAVVPIAVGQIAVLGVFGDGITGLSFGWPTVVLLLASGAITAIPLLLFGAANRRLPLSHLGFLQFLTPILSFLYGWLVAHEPMNAVRWIGFVAVWAAVLVLIGDMIATVSRHRKTHEPFSDVDIPVTGEIGIVPAPEKFDPPERAAE